ncbi:MAG TPA: alpha/beta hydrolase [Tepidisphaeraceae bacterium]|jgi:pimeloyl-ACP methyl ester carboxylesterase|nr:alpha/beta hydrolase [Tepidisphaeraceae bacterium]
MKGLPYFALAFALLAFSGCANYLGKEIVTAPNLAHPTRGVDAPPDVLQSLCITRQLRVPVDRNASLWVGVCDPNDSEENLSLKTDGKLLIAKIDRRPATQPATQPITPRGTIFMLHGLQEDQERGPYIVYREMLVHSGYRCVQVDLRGHGRSTGDFVTYGVEESRDLKQVLDVMQSQDMIAGDVGVIGASYGASIAIQWAAVDPRIKAVVALEPFATLNDAAVDAAPAVLDHWRWCFTDHTLLEAVRRGGVLANFDPKEASPLAAIARSSQPVLLIHSRGDELVPFQHSERLHAAAPNHSKLLLVDKQSHFTMWFQSINLIRKQSIAWLDEYVAHGKPTTRQQVPEIRNSTQVLTRLGD